MNKLLSTKIVCIVLFNIIMTNGCDINTTDPNTLVPATVDQNPDLTSIEIRVANHNRLIHYKTFGDQTNSPLFIMHGSLSDMRAYLPLSVLDDKYYVVMWDQRGNGLSERVTTDELTYQAMVDEIRAVKNLFSPDRRISIIGHSWSAVFVALYLAEFPDDIEQAVMIEPFGLKSEFMDEVDIPLNITSESFLDMMYSTKYLVPQNNEILDYQMLAVLKSGVRNYFCDINNLPEWPVWRVGGFALIVWERNLLKGTEYDYDFSTNLLSFPRKVMLVGSECSPIGYEFQKDYNKTLFSDADVLEIKNSGHRIITEQLPQLLDGLKSYLNQY